MLTARSSFSKPSNDLELVILFPPLATCLSHDPCLLSLKHMAWSITWNMYCCSTTPWNKYAPGPSAYIPEFKKRKFHLRECPMSYTISRGQIFFFIFGILYDTAHNVVESVETLCNKIDFRAFWTHYPSFPPNNVDVSVSSTAQTTAPALHWIGGLGVSENQH